MNLLHVGPSSPHIERVKRMFSRYAPEVRQWEGQCPSLPDLTFVHNATDYLRFTEEASPPVVAWVWNDRFLTEGLYDRDRCLRALNACALVVGDAESRARDVLPPEKWVGIRPLVEASVFHPPAPGAARDIPVLVARGWNGHPLYWPAETREALRGMEGVVWVDGKRTQGEMADLYRRSRCVVALREDAGPSYTVVEAALCGAIPVVSDTPANRKHFTDGAGELATEMGAALVERSPLAIRDAVLQVLGDYDDFGWSIQAERRRNLAYFSTWTAEAQGPALVRRVLEVAG